MRTANRTIEDLIHAASDELTNAGYHEAQIGKADALAVEWTARRQKHVEQAIAHKTRFAEIVEEIRKMGGAINA